MESFINKFGSCKRTGNGDEIRFNCPFCVEIGKTPDIHYHLWLNTRLNIFHCFRCNKSGKINQIGKATRRTALYENMIMPENKENMQKKISCINFDDIINTVGMEYWFSRGLTYKEARKYKVRYDKKNNQIVIPIFDTDGREVSFIKRIIFNVDNPYYFEKGFKKSNYLFNLNAVNSNIILVEGAFDAIAIDPFGVALLGKFMSEKQLFKLREKNIKKIFVSLDIDAKMDQEIIINKLLPFFDVEALDIDYKDFAEFRKKEGKNKIKKFLECLF